MPKFHIFFPILLVFLLSPFAAKAGVYCAGTTCPDNNLCLDRGDGSACYAICRFDWQCATGCCIQVVAPYVAWICGTEADCGSGSATDGDQDSSTVTQTGEPGPCGDSYICTEDEVCEEFDAEEGPICVPLCYYPGDCDSECCAYVPTGQKVCYPEDAACPEDESAAPSNLLDPSSCLSTTGGGMEWLLALLLLVLLRRGRERGKV